MDSEFGNSELKFANFPFPRPVSHQKNNPGSKPNRGPSRIAVEQIPVPGVPHRESPILPPPVALFSEYPEDYPAESFFL